MTGATGPRNSKTAAGSLPPSGGRTRRSLDPMQLLASVASHLRENGLVGFTLRRAAAEAGTTHKVLLYHFGSTEMLLKRAVTKLVSSFAKTVSDGRAGPDAGGLAGAFGQLWEIWRSLDGPPQVLEEVVVAGIPSVSGADHLRRYVVTATMSIVESAVQRDRPTDASSDSVDLADQAVHSVTLIASVLRGLLLDLRATGDEARVSAAAESFVRMLAAGRTGESTTRATPLTALRLAGLCTALGSCSALGRVFGTAWPVAMLTGAAEFSTTRRELHS